MVGMWRNYLTVGTRALAKSRTYAFITIIGLAIGMAAFLMIMLFVRHELSYDEWLDDRGDIYQVQTWYSTKGLGEGAFLQMTSYPALQALAKDFPQVEKQVFLVPSTPVLIGEGEPQLLRDFHYVDANLLDVLPLPLVAGDRRALDTVGNALITQSEARRHFGTEDVVGRTMTQISKGRTYDFRIAGVLKDLPSNTHLRISGVARLDFPSFFNNEDHFFRCWSCQEGWAYAKLRPGTDPAVIEAALPDWERRNIPEEQAGEARFNAGDEQDWHLVPVREVHLGKAQGGAMAAGNDRGTVATFGIVAVLILAMAVINFVNLATAHAGQRAREVALRKVLGGSRKQLIVQFLGEAILLTLGACIVALAMVELLLPTLAGFLAADLHLRYFGPGGIALPALLLVLVVGIGGGLYPAFVMARFRPAAVLKANKSGPATPGSERLRSLLVVGQFAVSIGLIICTAVIYGQTLYARTADPGFKRDQILQVDGLNRYQLMFAGNEIVRRVRQVPGVEAVGRTTIGLGSEGYSDGSVVVPGKPGLVDVGMYSVDEGLLDAMGLRLLAGRWVDADDPMDDMTLGYPASEEAQRALARRGANVVINERAAQRMGFPTPEAAIGKQVRGSIVEARFGLVPLTIVGVVADSRLRSMRLPIDALMLRKTEMGHRHLIVRYSGDPEKVRDGVERVWEQMTREVPFSAEFSEDILSELYRADDARARIFALFSLLAIIVACLGLFGLAAFTAERRTREIGIRKVLGARTPDIFRMLTWQFSRPVILANLLAWPVAWWVMQDWLGGFDSRIALGPAPFLAAGLIAFLVAILTIGAHAVRVARANPIHALRYE